MYGRSNPFGDDDDDGGFGGARGSSSGGYGARDPLRGGSNGYRGDARPGPGAGMSRGGYGGYDARDDPVPDYETRMMMANKRMEDSSANSLRVLNETMRMGIDTTNELDRQAESLDKTERMLDEMHVDLDRGEQHLRKIKSPFGGVANYFSRKKKVEEVTDPKGFKGSTKPKPAEKGKPQKKQAQRQAATPESTGNEIVDRNLDEMEKALHQLHGIGQVIGYQLDESDQQLDRIGYKMERNHVKVDKLNKGIRKELYK